MEFRLCEGHTASSIRKTTAAEIASWERLVSLCATMPGSHFAVRQSWRLLDLGMTGLCRTAASFTCRVRGCVADDDTPGQSPESQISSMTKEHPSAMP